jgi:hypothetical protein
VAIVASAFSIGMFVVIILINFHKIPDCNKYNPLKMRSSRELTPYLNNETGYWTFKVDDDFVIMQITDIHIGHVEASVEADERAIKAVDTLVRRIKPDLVILTGDISDNGDYEKEWREAKPIADLLNGLKVYWTITFGNHEVVGSERKMLASFYEGYKPYCLFEEGDEKSLSVGNTLINIENSEKKLIQSLVLIDSNGFKGSSYDNIHEDEIIWYEQSLEKMKEYNNNNTVNSLAFFHIPLQEFEKALIEYLVVGRNTSRVQWLGGRLNEWPGIPEDSDNMFETIKKLNSTK